MTVHLKKLSVGSESLAGLRHWQAERVRNGMELMHVTRNTPRRAEEVLDGGSIFWVIKGVMCARQPITELRSMQRKLPEGCSGGTQVTPHRPLVRAPRVAERC